MKKTLILFLALISMSLFSQNIAFVSQSKLLDALPKYKQLAKEKDSLKKSFETELQKESKATNDKIETLIKPYNVKQDESMETLKARMKPIDVEKLNLLVEEDKFSQKKKASYEKQLTDFMTIKINPLITKLNSSIETYATKNKIDVIYVIENLAPALAYYNKKKDVTDSIIELIKK